jgi:hypothetical protein
MSPIELRSGHPVSDSPYIPGGYRSKKQHGRRPASEVIRNSDANDPPARSPSSGRSRAGSKRVTDDHPREPLADSTSPTGEGLGPRLDPRRESSADGTVLKGPELAYNQRTPTTGGQQSLPAD